MDNAFGSTLRERRRALGITQGDLARALDLSVAFVSEVERGNRAPFATDKIVLAARTLKMDPETLLELAARYRGTFELSANVGEKAREVGAALMRGWGDLTDDDLEAIKSVLGGRERKSR